MRDNNSKPVYRNAGVRLDPPPPATPKKVFRTYYCALTQTTKVVERAVHAVRDSTSRRTVLVSRTPERPTDSMGFITREERRNDANERNAACAKLSVTERIEKLDRRFGVGQGAKKERERLLSPKKVVVTKAAIQASGVNQPHTQTEKVNRAIQHAQNAVTSGPAAKQTVRIVKK